MSGTWDAHWEKLQALSGESLRETLCAIDGRVVEAETSKPVGVSMALPSVLILYLEMKPLVLVTLNTFLVSFFFFFDLSFLTPSSLLLKYITLIFNFACTHNYGSSLSLRRDVGFLNSYCKTVGCS